MPAPSDDDLLEAMGSGDRTAFRDLMRRHAYGMLALSQRITGSGPDADEIVQEAFLKVWMLAPSWNRNGAARFATWLYRVVLNASIDCRRRAPLAAIEAAEHSVDPGPDALVSAVRQQRAVMIRAALREVPERQREVLALHYFSDVSGPDAARMLGVSAASVESLLVRGRRSLKAALLRRGVARLGDLA